jgi:hypothetical protein
MKKSQIFGIVAIALLMIGLFAVFVSFPHTTETRTFTIPEGEGFYYRFEFELMVDSNIRGNFTVTAGPEVTMMVFTESEYGNYSNTGGGVPLFATSGRSGNFSASDGGMTRMYLVFQHLSDTNDTNATNASVTYTMSGISIIFLTSGTILLASGGAMGFLSRRLRKIEARIAHASSVTADTEVSKGGPQGPRP